MLKSSLIVDFALAQRLPLARQTPRKEPIFPTHNFFLMHCRDKTDASQYQPLRKKKESNLRTRKTNKNRSMPSKRCCGRKEEGNWHPKVRHGSNQELIFKPGIKFYIPNTSESTHNMSSPNESSLLTLMTHIVINNIHYVSILH